jgi:hypothetical protein
MMNEVNKESRKMNILKWRGKCRFNSTGEEIVGQGQKVK